MQERETTESKTKSTIKTNMETKKTKHNHQKKEKLKTKSKKRQDERHFCNEQGIRRRYVTMRRPKGQQKNPASGLGAVGLQPFLVFCVFCLFTITLFSPENGFFCSFFSVSLSFSLASFIFPFSLSLSLFLYLVSCFLFPCFLVCYLLSLFFCCYFLPCFFAFVSRKKYLKGFFHQLFLFWGFSCFALSFKSLFFLVLFLSFFQLCVLVNINVFNSQRRPFLKHQVLFCALCKVIVFC